RPRGIPAWRDARRPWLPGARDVGLRGALAVPERPRRVATGDCDGGPRLDRARDMRLGGDPGPPDPPGAGAAEHQRYRPGLYRPGDVWLRRALPVPAGGPVAGDGPGRVAPGCNARSSRLRCSRDVRLRRA